MLWDGATGVVATFALGVVACFAGLVQSAGTRLGPAGTTDPVAVAAAGACNGFACIANLVDARAAHHATNPAGFIGGVWRTSL